MDTSFHESTPPTLTLETRLYLERTPLWPRAPDVSKQNLVLENPPTPTISIRYHFCTYHMSVPVCLPSIVLFGATALLSRTIDELNSTFSLQTKNCLLRK